MIDVSDFKNIFHDCKIIDIRNSVAYNNGHIEGSKNIPYVELIKDPKSYLNHTDIYYIYCQRGVTSLKACMSLRKNGYKVININGGYEEWIMES